MTMQWERDKEWKCLKCNTLNHGSTLQCGTCGFKKPKSSKAYSTLDQNESAGLVINSTNPNNIFKVISEYRKLDIMSHISKCKSVGVLNYDKDKSTTSPTELICNVSGYNGTGIDNKRFIASDADEELLILIEFIDYIDLNKITFYALPFDDSICESDMSPPKLIHIFKRDHINLNFDDVNQLKHDVKVTCIAKKLAKGQCVNMKKKTKNVVKFRSIKYLAIHIKSNQNDSDQTYLNGIRFNEDVAIKYNFTLHDVQNTKTLNDIYARCHEIEVGTVTHESFKYLKNEYTTNNVACELEKCDCLARISKILNKYQIYNGKPKEKPKTLDDIYSCDGYQNVNLVNDYNHLLVAHKQQFEEVYNYLVKECMCTLSNCKPMTRNCRNRDRSNNLYCHLKSLQDIVKMQLLDAMHMYYFHTFDTAYKLKKQDIKLIEENSVIEEKEIDENDLCSPSIDPRLRSLSRFIQEKTKSKQRFRDFNRFTTSDSTHNVSTMFTETKNTNENVIEEKTEKNTVLQYSWGMRYFYWDYYKNNPEVYDERQNDGFNHYRKVANKGYTLGDWYFEAKFKTLKEEMLYNSICTIDISQWDALYLKAMIKFQSTYAAQFMCRKGCPAFSREDTHFYFGKQEGEEIKLKHLIAVMIYCNFDILSTRFSETFRRIPMNESDESLKTRHSNYVHLAKFLRELECFGIQREGSLPQKQPIPLLFHGVSEDVSFQTTRACINGPFSTTSDYYVALQFCQFKGTILELKLDSFWNFRVYSPGFECHWLSDFANEQEWFFIGGSGHFEFENILRVVGAYNYAVYVTALTRLCCNQDFCGMYTMRNTNDMGDKIILQLLSNELYRYYPDKYHKFKSVPKYIENIFHNHCQHTTEMMWIHRTVHCYPLFFLYDKTNWVKLKLLTKVFPLLKRIRLMGYDVSICKSAMANMLSFLSKTPNTNLEEVSLDEFKRNNSELSIEMSVNMYRNEFLKYGWMIYKQDGDLDGILMLQSMDADEVQVAIQMEKENKTYPDIIGRYFTK
eukprot:100676_1